MADTVDFIEGGGQNVSVVLVKLALAECLEVREMEKSVMMTDV